MEPFREKVVVNHLVAYLSEQGFEVDQQVTVQNGRADIIARRSDEILLIEAKGEDKGGYASAEMNLLMGFGQVLSRMNETSWHYGLALPLTPDFQKALSKYAGSFGIRHLNWTFFLIYNDGQVNSYDSTDFQNFIDKL